MANEFSDELDLPGGYSGAAFSIARPPLPNSQLEVGWDPSNQRMTVERTGGQRSQRIAA
jgi:hypothetical protein